MKFHCPHESGCNIPVSKNGKLCDGHEWKPGQVLRVAYSDRTNLTKNGVYTLKSINADGKILLNEIGGSYNRSRFSRNLQGRRLPKKIATIPVT